MKKIIHFLTNVTALCLGLLFLLISCQEDHNILGSVPKAKGARIKFVYAAPGGPGVNFFVNDIKVTSGGINLPLSFFSSFPATDYSVIPGGSVNVKVKGLVNNVETLLLETTLNLTDENYYSFIVTGIAPNYTTMLVNDNVAQPNDGQARIRFVNLIPNSANIDLITTVAPTGAAPGTLFSNIAFKGGDTNFSLLGLGTTTNGASATTGVFTVRIVDSVTKATLATLATASSTFVGNKVYTLVARGQIGGSGATAPVLDRIINR